MFWSNTMNVMKLLLCIFSVFLINLIYSEDFSGNIYFIDKYLNNSFYCKASCNELDQTIELGLRVMEVNEKSIKDVLELTKWTVSYNEITKFSIFHPDKERLLSEMKIDENSDVFRTLSTGIENGINDVSETINIIFHSMKDDFFRKCGKLTVFEKTNTIVIEKSEDNKEASSKITMKYQEIDNELFVLDKMKIEVYSSGFVASEDYTFTFNIKNEKYILENVKVTQKYLHNNRHYRSIFTIKFYDWEFN